MSRWFGVIQAHVPKRIQAGKLKRFLKNPLKRRRKKTNVDNMELEKFENLDPWTKSEPKTSSVLHLAVLLTHWYSAVVQFHHALYLIEIPKIESIVIHY